MVLMSSTPSFRWYALVCAGMWWHASFSVTAVKLEKQRALRRYLGMVNYYHRFIPHCVKKLTPLNNLLTEVNEGQNRLSPKSNFDLHWTEKANSEFTESKQILAT